MRDTTFLGIHFWSKKIFSKLGWMLLAHNEDNKDQLKSYVHSIKNLIKHIDIKIDFLHKLTKPEEDCLTIITHLHDMEILKKNANILLNYAEYLCKTCKPSKKIMKGGDYDCY